MANRGHSSEGRKEIIQKLIKFGWYEVTPKRSGHLQFKHPTIPGKVTVPQKITKNTELSIARQAGWRRNINREQLLNNKMDKEKK